jgi:hypothetical protein
MSPLSHKIEFKIESRIPLELFKIAPFIYTGPDFISFPLGMISDFIYYKNKKLQRFYPLTVSMVTQGKLIDQLFCFSFIYINDEEKLVLYLTQPILINIFSLQQTIDFFIKKINELAIERNCEQIELEIHEISTYPIGYPTSLSHLSYNVNEFQSQNGYLELFQQYEFNEVNSLFCYGQNIDEIYKNINKIKIRKYKSEVLNQTDFIKIKGKLNLLPIKAFTLTTKDLTIFNKIILPFDKSMFILHKQNHIYAFFQWVPNLFELFNEFRTPIPYLFYNKFKNYSFKIGKIIDWAIAEENEELFINLLSGAIISMKQRGIKNCQIANISYNQSFIKNLLDSLGFRKIHTIKLLRRRVI